MFDVQLPDTADKPVFYAELRQMAEGLLHGEHDRIANAANLSALLYQALPEVNWVGFYFEQAGELLVGPFQGRPACVHIPLGRGVCGTAAAERRTVLVADVNRFDGHIACDAASQSEIVIPLIRGETLLGVLDVDSPVTERFDAADQAGLEAIAALYVASLR